MEYLVILGLAGWVWLQWRRIEDLAQSIRTLEAQVRALAAGREPLLLTNPLPAEAEPLLLDRPLPAAANDDAAGENTAAADPAPGIEAPAWAIAAAIIALFVGYFVAFAADDVRLALGLLVGATALGFAPAFYPPLQRQFAIAPSVTLSVSGVLLIWTWPAIAASAGQRLAEPGLAAIVLIALSAVGVRKRWAHAASFGVTVCGVVLGVAGYMRARALAAPMTPDIFAWSLVLAAAIVAASYAARSNRHGRATISAAGACSAAALVTLAASSRGDLSSILSLSALLGGTAALAGWAVLQARATANAAWPLAGAVFLALLSVHAATPLLLLPPALTLASWGFAYGFARTDTRVLQMASVIAALLAILHTVGGDFARESGAGLSAPWASLASVIAAAGFTFGAWRTLRFDNNDTSLAAESLRACAFALVLISALLWADALGLSPFTTAGLHALILIAAGHASAPRQEAPTGVIGRWQGPALIGAGLTLALYVCGLELNPWWGDTPARIGGPPVLNALLVAFALPSVAALISAGRWHTRAPNFSRLCLAAATLLLLLWLLLTARRALHAAAMNTALVGAREALVYVALVLSLGLGLRTQQDRARFANLVHGSYERFFGAPTSPPAAQPLPQQPISARRRRNRR